MRYLIFLFLLLLPLTIQAQNQSDFISEEKIIAFTKFWWLKDGFQYLEAMEDAQKVFIIGSKVNQVLLKKYFKTNSPPLFSKELRHNHLQEYILFAGGDGIVAQVVVLFVDKDDKVEKLEIISWGR